VSRWRLEKQAVYVWVMYKEEECLLYLLCAGATLIHPTGEAVEEGGEHSCCMGPDERWRGELEVAWVGVVQCVCICMGGASECMCVYVFECVAC